jgi:hypothetical protein
MQIEANNSIKLSIQVVRPPYDCCYFWARFSRQIVQQLILGQSVRYGCLCTDFEVADVGFLLVNFKHENRREEISKLLVLFLLICNFRNFRNKKNSSLSLVFPTLGFFQGHLTKYHCVIKCVLAVIISEFLRQPLKRLFISCVSVKYHFNI